MMNAKEAVIAAMIAFFMGALFVGMARPNAIECMQARMPISTTHSNVDQPGGE